VRKKTADRDLAGGSDAGQFTGSSSRAYAVQSVSRAHTSGVSAGAQETARQRMGRFSTHLRILILALPVAIILLTTNSWSETRRQIVDANTFPWSSIGKLNNSAGGQCTAAVIGPNQFLTAAHCLYNFGAGRFISPGSIHFLLGYEKGEYRVHRTASRYSIPPTFDPTKINGPFKAIADDWAILYTSEPFPLDIRPLRMARVIPSPGKELMTGGYTQERAYMMTADEHCRIELISTDRKLIAHNCAIQHGDSGGPLLSRDANDDGLIVGINVIKYRTLSKQGGESISTANITEFLTTQVVESIDRKITQYGPGDR
jgi:protease YdgD